jgi:mRNA interferase RelE/StbE
VTPCSLRFKDSVEKDLRRLPAEARSRCLERAEALRENPRPRAAAKLTGRERTYRLRVGRYRVVYQIDDEERTVTVEYVRHRGRAYT